MTAPAAADPPDAKTFRVLFLIVLADMIGFGIVLPILPVYARDFHAPDWQVTLLLAVYSACQFVASPVLGTVSDRVGRRPVLVFSQLGSATAGLILAAATYFLTHSPLGLAVVFASRMVDGFSAGNLSAAQAVVGDTVAPQHRSRFMGLLGAAFGVGFALGPTLGGLLGHFNAALAPLAAAGCSATAATLTYLYLPESLDTSAARPARHVGRSLALLREPRLAQVNLIWFLAMWAFATAESVYAIFLQDAFGFSLLGIGLMFGLAGLTIIVVQGRAIGPLTRRLGEWNLAAAGPFVFAVAMALFAVLTRHPAVGLLLVAAIVNGVGRSLQTPSLLTITSHQAKPGQQGAALGLFQGFGSLARVAGPAAAGALYHRGRVLPYLLAGGLTLAAGVWTTLLRPRVGDAGPV